MASLFGQFFPTTAFPHPESAPSCCSITEGHTAALSVFAGSLRLDGSVATEAELAVFERAGTDLLIEAESDAKFLVLSGEPLEEPLAGYGPFVMNTQQEIRQALSDYQSGRMGHLA